jgi:hypothetical protein
VPSYYYVGEKKYQLLHTILRKYCSSLKEQLFSKNIIESPYVNLATENTSHYFFSCPRYHYPLSKHYQTHV